MPQILHRLTLPSFRGASPQHVPVVVMQAREPGPSVVVTANVHGDEATGIGAIHQLLQRLDQELIRGSVALYPSLNLPGLMQGTRALPVDGQDLNRQFPGDPRGTASERHASALWRDITSRRPDALIDLHADSPASIPYTLMDRVCRGEPSARAALQQRVRALGDSTGFMAINDYVVDDYIRYQLDRSLTGAVIHQLGVPAVTVECGPRLYLDPAAVETATAAVLGALHGLGLVARPALPHPTRVSGGPWRRQPGPRASTTGILHPLRRPGQTYSRGDTFAEIRSLEGRVIERLVCASDGCVLSLPERAWMTAGVSAGTCAVPDSP